MKIILDTNIYCQDFMMGSGKSKIFLDYLQKTKTQLLMPEVVYKELAGVYRRELVKRLEAFENAQKKLSRSLVCANPPAFPVSVEREVGNYVTHIKHLLGINENGIFKHSPHYLDDIVDRAIQRRRSCSDKGEELRDALVWCCVLDIAGTDTDKKVVFISNNTSEFGQENGKLHPDLSAECASRGVEVVFYTSIDLFNKEHASKIEYVTPSWIMASLDQTRLKKDALRYLEKFGRAALERELARRADKPTGYVNPYAICLSGAAHPDVYEMSDGSIRIEATLTGKLEVEYEDEIAVESHLEDFDYDPLQDRFSWNPVFRATHEREVILSTSELELFIDLELTVLNQSIRSTEITGFSLQ